MKIELQDKYDSTCELMHDISEILYKYLEDFPEDSLEDLWDYELKPEYRGEHYNEEDYDD